MFMPMSMSISMSECVPRFATPADVDISVRMPAVRMWRRNSSWPQLLLLPMLLTLHAACAATTVCHCFALNAIYVAVSRRPLSLSLSSCPCPCPCSRPCLCPGPSHCHQEVALFAVVFSGFGIRFSVFGRRSWLVGVNARTCVEQKALTSSSGRPPPSAPAPPPLGAALACPSQL